MASREIRAVIDLLGTPQYRRLVEFVEEAEHLARVTCDEDLQEMVERVRADLLRMPRRSDPSL